MARRGPLARDLKNIQSVLGDFRAMGAMPDNLAILELDAAVLPIAFSAENARSARKAAMNGIPHVPLSYFPDLHAFAPLYTATKCRRDAPSSSSVQTATMSMHTTSCRRPSTSTPEALGQPIGKRSEETLLQRLEKNRAYRLDIKREINTSSEEKRITYLERARQYVKNAPHDEVQALTEACAAAAPDWFHASRAAAGDE